jgi:sortase B
MKQERKVNNRKKRIKRMVCLFFLLALVVTGYFVYHYYQNDKKQENRFNKLEEIEEERDKKPVPSILPTEITNPDWIGWLKIKGTSISYPVMQREGDSEYYLHRDFDGKYSFYGTPFLDSRCTLDSDNCIVYGHNINGGRMFGALHAYSSERYYKEYPEISFRAGDEKRQYQIVSVMQTTTSSPVYSFTDVGNWDEYGEYVNKILSGSLYQTEMGKQIREELEKDTPEEFFRKYEFLTLSTCRSWVGRNARLLVVSVRKLDEIIKE